MFRQVNARIRPAYWLLAGLLALSIAIVMLVASARPSAAGTALPLTPIPGRLPKAHFPGVYTFEDYTNVNPNDFAVIGGHMNFNWQDFNPAPGYYDWSKLDEWIHQETSLGKKVAFAVNVYKGVDSGGDMTPRWVYDQHPNARIFCYDEFSVPKYWDRDWQNAYRTFLQALARRYDGDPRIAFIEVATGIYGEARPTEAALYPCMKKNGLTSELWITTVDRIIQMYQDTFQRTALVFQVGHYLEWRDRRETADYAAQRGIGLKWNLLIADTGNAVFDNPQDNYDCTKDDSCGSGWAELMWKWWRQVPIGFEGYDNAGNDVYLDYFNDTNGQFIWGVYNALDKHADYFVLNTNITANPKNEAALRFANKYAGRTAADAPSAWVALRDSDPNNPLIGSRQLRQHTNFSFFLYQDDNVPGGKTVPAFNVGPQPEGRFTRRTDQNTGNPCMYFKVDDDYFYNGPPGVTINVTYYDKGRDTWELQYDALGATYKSAGVVRKTNTGRWVTRSFRLADALLANRERGGSDFRICSRNDGDEYIHFVEVIRNANAVPTPTSTFTPTPTAVEPSPTSSAAQPVYTMEIQQGVDGYGGSTDTYITSEANTKNFGRMTVLDVDTRGAYRGLIRFDRVPRLPPGATLIKADIAFYYLKREGQAWTGWMRAYDLHKSWQETEATWLQARNGLPWARAGAEDTTYDRAPHLTGDTWVAYPSQWYALDVTPLMQRWLAAPETNHGILIKGWINGNKHVRMEFASDQYPDPTKRPKLILYYTLPTPTPTPCPGGLCATDTPAPTPTPVTPGAPTPSPTSTPTPSPTPTPTTVVLQDGRDPGTGVPYSGAEDTYIDRWQPDSNDGAGMTLELRRDVRESLIRFDTRLIPTHATVYRAQLQVWVTYRTQNDPITVGAFELRREWLPLQATWREAKAETPWQQPGAKGEADRDPQAASTTVITATGAWVTLDLTSMVQKWVQNPSHNYGLLLEATAGGPGFYTLFSSDTPELDKRPKLIVTYAADVTGPPQPTATATTLPTTTETPTASPTLAPTGSASQTLTLYRGALVDGNIYTGTADAYISRWQPAANYGQEGTLLIRSGAIRLGLLRFSLDVLPANAIVQQATLSLYQTTRDHPLPMTLKFYRLLRPWDETSVTWQWAGTTAWEQPGAQGNSDRQLQPVAETHLDQNRGWVQVDVTALVRDWAQHPSQNMGLLMAGESSGGVQYTFLAAEWGDARGRPRLTVHYVLATPTPTPTATPTPTPTATPTPTPSPTPTFTPTRTPTPTPTPSPTPTFTPTIPLGTPTPPWPTPTPGPKELFARVRVTPVAVDGSLAEWTFPPSAYLVASTADTVLRSTPTPSDLTGWLWAAWDGDYLYFAVHVVDDVVVDNNSVDVWRDDGVEIAVNGSPNNQAGHDFHQITLVADGRTTDFGGSQPLPPGTLHAVRHVPGGYVAELALPWSALGISAPSAGQQLHFTWGIHDDDNGGDWDSYLIWAGHSTVTPDQGLAPLILLAGTQLPTPTPTPTVQVSTVVLQDGVGSYTGTRDTTLDRWLPTTPLGGETMLTLRAMGDTVALLQFGNLPLPKNAQVRSATLELYLVQRSTSTPVMLSAYRLQRPWVERQATWYLAEADTPWDVPGALGEGDRGGVIAQTTVLRRSGWVALDITGEVQDWVRTPADNKGIALQVDTSYPAELRFPSREWLGVNVRPRLTIVYTLPSGG